MALVKRQGDEPGAVLVTFSVPAEVGAREASVVGEFNNWSVTANAMAQLDGAGFETTLSLPAGRTYRFRYLLDRRRWENDWVADGYVPNEYGGEDSVVDLTAANQPGPEVEAPGKPKSREPKVGEPKRRTSGRRAPAEPAS